MYLGLRERFGGRYSCTWVSERGSEADTRIPGPRREVRRLFSPAHWAYRSHAARTWKLLLDSYLLIASIIGTHLPKNYSINYLIRR